MFLNGAWRISSTVTEMLRPPHTCYHTLFVYYLDRIDLPPIRHPDFIGLWKEDEHGVIFFHSSQDELVSNIAADTGASLLYQAEMAYQDWEAGLSITPFSTKTLSVRPVWEKIDNGDHSKQEIVLDPSVIFGSGFHPTTRMCLQQLERLMLKRPGAIGKVVDLGTGTGLLAIGAAMLGASEVTAVDNNPLACLVARNNVAINKCGSSVQVREMDLTSGLPDLAGCDLVMANLHKGLLERLFAEEAFWRADRHLISGIMPSMEGDLLAALPSHKVCFRHRESAEIWRLWYLSKPGR